MLHIYARALRYELQFHVNVAMNEPAAAFVHADVVSVSEFHGIFQVPSSQQRLANCTLVTYMSPFYANYIMSYQSL